ncbi:hypothetical protein GCM10023168_18750 [Fodinibacter luteus]|uniref:Secreted protein n=1 Tax=Fodinibacter luteus TaxID=552064 RepID=A0ABP8KFD3_9MICO
MNRPTTRRLAPVVTVALALLLAGCSSDEPTDGSAGSSPAASAAASASAELCDSFAELKTDAADLASAKVDASGTPEEVQQQVDALAAKADKVRDDLNTMMVASDGGPAAAVIGALNQKADALKEELTIAKAGAQEDLAVKVTAAQEEVATALEPVTTTVGALCPSS